MESESTRTPSLGSDVNTMSDEELRSVLDVEMHLA
jgi:hypothetical protein